MSIIIVKAETCAEETTLLVWYKGDIAEMQYSLFLLDMH